MSKKAADLIAAANASSERRAATLAAKKSPELHSHQAPEGYRLRGVSTLLDGGGNVVQTWVKTAKEMDSPQALLDAFAEAVADRDITPAKLVKPAKSHDADLLTVYPMGDPHIGMLSWHAETGQDFDTKIATANLSAAVQRLVTLAPPSKRALVINVGDFFHSDNGSNRTARSGHQLDVDGRWAKVFQAGARCFVDCIDQALTKHEHVTVICAIGNHDDYSSQMLAILLSTHYRLNPRVHVDTSPSKFHWYEFGTNLIGVTHGDTVKLEALPGIMATDKPAEWGRTDDRRWYTGHVHHMQTKEFPGCTVETFRTLAARDAWHHGQGYRAGRSMCCDVLHRTRGLTMRHHVGVEGLPHV